MQVFLSSKKGHGFHLTTMACILNKLGHLDQKYQSVSLCNKILPCTLKPTTVCPHAHTQTHTEHAWGLAASKWRISLPIHLLLCCLGDKYTYRVSIYFRNVLFRFPAMMNVSFINPSPGLLNHKQYFSSPDSLCSSLGEPWDFQALI